MVVGMVMMMIHERKSPGQEATWYTVKLVIS